VNKDRRKSLAIGSDHAGFALKQQLVEHLQKKGYDIRDIGCPDESSVDYPDFAAAVARLVAGPGFEKGILVCGSGLGVAIAANKIAGVRAVTANDLESARLSRAHNDANVLALGARLVRPASALEIVDAWLDTEFEGGRHQQRLDKIARLESGPEEPETAGQN
jgi:ribose 5-phosphate isomerase B